MWPHIIDCILNGVSTCLYNQTTAILTTATRPRPHGYAQAAAEGGLGVAIDNLSTQLSKKLDELIATRQTGFLTSMTTDCDSSGCSSGDDFAVTAFGRFLIPGAPYVCAVTHGRNASDPYDAGVILSSPATVVAVGAGVQLTCDIPGGAARNIKHAEFDAVFTLVEGGKLDIPIVTGRPIIHFVNEAPVVGLDDRTVLTQHNISSSGQVTIPVSIEDINTPDLDVFTVTFSIAGNSSGVLDSMEFRASDSVIVANVSAGARALLLANTDTALTVTFEIAVADTFDHVTRTSATLVFEFNPCASISRQIPTSCTSNDEDKYWDWRGSNCNSLSDGDYRWAPKAGTHWGTLKSDGTTELYFDGAGRHLSEVRIFQHEGGR